MTNDELNVPTTTQKSTYESIHIRPGTYAIRLKNASLFKDAAGQWIKPEFGQRVKLEFDVHKILYDESNDEDDGEVGRQITTKAGNIEKDVVLTTLVNIAYAKNDFDTRKPIKDAQGNYIHETALKPTSKGMSKPTKIFMALGWKGPDASNTFNIKSLIGNWAQASINDYQPQDKDGNDIGEVQSQIVKDSIAPLKAKVPKNLNVAQEEVVGDLAKKPDTERYLAEVAQLKQQLDDGLLTPRGYENAIKSLKAIHGVDS